MRDVLYYGIVSTEILSIVISFIILYANIHESKTKTKKSLAFSVIVITNIVALVTDILSWVLELRVDREILLQVLSFFSFIFSIVLLIEFAFYMYYYISERRRISSTWLKYYLAFSAVSVVVIIITCFNQRMMYYENGVIEYGSFYTVYVIANILSLLFCFSLVTYYRKSLGVHDSIAAYIYILLPTVNAAVNLLVDGWEFAYTASTVSLLVIYVLLQSEHTTKLEKENAVSQYYANHDSLTGVFSRRAYVDKINDIIKCNDDVGIVFSDLNGLKLINDKYGHSEGDLLIIKYSQILLENFGKDNVYRISGDEFVVMLPGMKKSVFESCVANFEKSIIIDNKKLSCFGCDYGSGSEVQSLINAAESQMYCEKAEFHKNNPEYKR